MKMYLVKQDINAFIGLFIFICLLLLFCFPNAQAQINTQITTPGRLDSSFLGGRVIDDLTGNGHDEYVSDMAIQPDGKIVVVGHIIKDLGELGTQTDFFVVRYLDYGIKDISFGQDVNDDGHPDGYIIQNIDPDREGINWENQAITVAIDRSGNILVGGFAGSTPHIAIAKYDPNGDPVTLFGNEGVLYLPIAGHSRVLDILPLEDGGFLFAGYTFNTTSKDMVVGKCDVNGVRDPNFGNERCGVIGVTCLDFGIDEDDEASALALLSNGNILLAGYTVVSNTPNLALALLDSDGNPVPSSGGGGNPLSSFGSDGLTITTADEIGVKSVKAKDIVIDSDGNIYVATDVRPISSIRNIVVAKYNKKGALVHGFGVDGILKKDWGGYYQTAYSIALDKNDDPLLAGGVEGKFALGHYFSLNGRSDLEFGIGGFVTETDGLATAKFGNALFASAYAIAVDANGKILLAGRSSGRARDILLARFHGIVNTDGDNDTYYVETNDCDDTNAAIYPGAPEICGDGIDQDCSGSDLSCPTGKRRLRPKTFEGPTKKQDNKKQDLNKQDLNKQDTQYKF